MIIDKSFVITHSQFSVNENFFGRKSSETRKDGANSVRVGPTQERWNKEVQMWTALKLLYKP